MNMNSHMQQNINTQTIIIVVPIHKDKLSEEDRLSLKQLNKILGHYPCSFIIPEKKKVDLSMCNDFINHTTERFEDSYFSSIQGYNRLMLSAEFYNRYKHFSYMLVYQLDSYIFKDELHRFCNCQFDYIGAPWLLKAKYNTMLGKLFIKTKAYIHKLHNKPFRPSLLGNKIGNGGFSLRKIETFLHTCLTQKEEIAKYLDLSTKFSEYNEDAFWATRKNFCYPSLKEALSFSFDISPQLAYRYTKNIPMGCHGWSKPENKVFWQSIIYSAPTVLFDYQAFTHQRFGGVSRYFTEIITRLPKYDIKYKLNIWSSDNIHLRSKKIVSITNEYNVHADFLPKIKSPKKVILFKLLAKIAPERFPYAKYYNKYKSIEEIKKNEFQIFHPTYYDPYFLKYDKNRPFVLTIHDMIDEIMKEGKRTPKRKALLAQKATHIIAVSQQTKNDIIQMLHVPENKISVVYHGASLLEQESHDIPSLPLQYILFVGGRERKYKNFLLFIEAVTPILKNRNIDIVCVGAQFTKKEQNIFRQYGINNNIHNISAKDNQLFHIYKHASCFVFPSSYEGFGIPILEAFQAQCPIVLSNSSCFPEVAQDAALYFAPNNAEDMRKKILMILDNPKLAQELVEKGIKRLQFFSWEKAAQETSIIYKRILATRQ